MEVQAGYLKQVKDLADIGVGESVPVICAGDIFDRWNPPPELINFALKHLPQGMITVPGQHDLPNHRIDQMNRCAYGVLVEAGKIKDISGSVYTGDSFGFAAYGFGWGEEIEPLLEKGRDKDRNKAIIHLAVIHKYCWTADKKYPGAPEEANLQCFAKSLRGYDAAVFGDNHLGFTAKAGACNVINCGGFIRRKSDEIKYTPMVGLLMSDGTIKRHKLDTTDDKFHEAAADVELATLDMQKFIKELEGLGEEGLNFREAVENHLRKEKLSTHVKEIILSALDANPKI